MTGTNIIKHKWFWPWQDEEEEAWLRKMALSGLHLAKPDYFARYEFTRGEAQDMVYRLDYQPGAAKDKASYYQLFADAGWERVGEMGGWQYFRKAAISGENLEIFTDKDSKIQKYRRLLLLFVPLMPGYLLLLAVNPAMSHDGLSQVMMIIGIPLVLFYIYLISGVLIRINQLKKR